MPQTARKLELEPEANTVMQYWICLEVPADRQGQHVYFLDGKFYAVTGYIGKMSDAIRMCSDGKRIAEVEVHNYQRSQLLAHKVHFKFKHWAHIKPAKAPE
jgi:hypothetical protein